MIEDQIAARVEVDTIFDEYKTLISRLTITKPDLSESIFEILWDAQEVRRL